MNISSEEYSRVQRQMEAAGDVTSLAPGSVAPLRFRTWCRCWCADCRTAAKRKHQDDGRGLGAVEKDMKRRSCQDHQSTLQMAGALGDPTGLWTCKEV